MTNLEKLINDLEVAAEEDCSWTVELHETLAVLGPVTEEFVDYYHAMYGC